MYYLWSLPDREGGVREKTTSLYHPVRFLFILLRRLNVFTSASCHLSNSLQFLHTASVCVRVFSFIQS